jgi:hypothetical protein
MRHDKVGHFTNAEQDAATATERRSGKVEHAEPERLAGQPVSDQAVRCGGSIGDDLRLTYTFTASERTAAGAAQGLARREPSAKLQTASRSCLLAAHGR